MDTKVVRLRNQAQMRPGDIPFYYGPGEWVTVERTDRLESAAAELGKEYGKNAASWAVEADMSAKDAAEVVRMIDEGDPAFEVSPAPLSGEYADGLTVERVLDELGEPVGLETESEAWVGRRDDLEQYDEVLQVFEDAYYQAFEDKVYSEATKALATLPDVDQSRTYKVAGWSEGIAWRVTSLETDGRVLATMVGDDREHLFDASDLTPLEEDDYCAECGGIGCSADGR